MPKPRDNDQSGWQYNYCQINNMLNWILSTNILCIPAQLFCVWLYSDFIFISFSFFSYFDGNVNIPVHSTNTRAMLAEEIVSILFEVDESNIATEQPLHCNRTACFVINCDRLSHLSDIRMDDLGSWTSTGVDRLYVNVKFSDEKKISSVKKLSSRPAVMHESIYRLTRSYWKHKQNPSFCRQLHQITAEFESELVLLCYCLCLVGDLLWL